MVLELAGSGGLPVTLTNVTITQNRSSGTFISPSGGGIWMRSGDVRLNNSIVAGNVNETTASTDDLGAFFEAECHNNLLGVGGIGLVDGVNGNQVGVTDPRLAPLGDYGGPTQTMPPLPGSPALDAGSNAFAVDAAGQPLSNDRAVCPRIVNGTADIGAVEKQANASTLPATDDGLVVTLQSPSETTLSNVTAVAAPPPDQRAGTGLPKPANLPVGAFDFTVNGVTLGATVEVILFMPAGTAVNAYYKYNASTRRWSKFNGATFEDRNGDGTPDVVLRLRDGGSGDQDGIANTIIVDPGAPAFLPTLQVQIDVKPGDSSNSTNLTSNGVIAVAILASADFDPATVNVGSVLFAGARAVKSSWADVNGDGCRDLVLNFRTQDTNLRALYEQLLADDINADGVLDSNHQEANVALTGETTDEVFLQGIDQMDLFLAGKALRTCWTSWRPQE